MANGKQDGSAIVSGKVILQVTIALIFAIASFGLGGMMGNTSDIADNAKAIAAIDAKFPVAIPPDWFRRQVDANTDAIKEMGKTLQLQNGTILERLHKIETEIAKLAASRPPR